MNGTLSERATASQLLRLAANTLEEHPMPRSAVTVTADEVQVLVYDPCLTAEQRVEAINSLAQHLHLAPGSSRQGVVFSARGDRLGVHWVISAILRDLS